MKRNLLSNKVSDILRIKRNIAVRERKVEKENKRGIYSFRGRERVIETDQESEKESGGKVIGSEGDTREQEKTEQNEIMQDSTRQDKTKQNKTKQNKTKQNKTKQNKAQQSKAKQNKAKQNRTRQNGIE